MNHILFPITYNCNLSCAGCCAINQRNISIDIEKSLNAIKSKAGKIEWVYITGGEPFLIENLSDVCDQLKNAGFKVGITTNGTIFKPELAKHADRIGISIDGRKEYHDAYRGPGVYDKALQLFNAIKGDCETVIMSVAFKENLEELTLLAPIIKDLDPTYWQIQRDVFNPELVIPESLSSNL